MAAAAVGTAAMRIARTGGPEVLERFKAQTGEPGPGQARVRHEAVGVNYIDVYHRTGHYPLPLPSGIGVEGAGIVEAVGPGVTHVAAGDRVAYAGGPPGSYAAARLIPADRLVRLPDGLATETAAAAIFQGLTVEYLIRRTYAVRPGDTVLFHAAAGGVGLIACQWLKHLGAVVIGAVGTDEKAALARAHGCDHAIVYTREDVAQAVHDITGGRGVPVVYDSVGRDTFAASLDCLRPRGLLVSFGSASGPVPPLALDLLRAKGSLYVTRPTIATYVAARDELEAAAGELFRLLLDGTIEVTIGGRYKLAEAAQAHRDLEARRTTGALILTP